MANHNKVLAEVVQVTRWRQLNGLNHLKGMVTREADLEVDPGHALGDDNHEEVQGRLKDKDHQFSAANINLNDEKWLLNP